KLSWDDLNSKQPTRIQNDVLDYENAVEKLLAREVGEEAGITIGAGLHYINSVAFIRPDEIPVVLVKFAAKYKSGEVRIEEGAFTDYAWVNVGEVGKYPCIEGIEEEIAATIQLFAEKKN
ncbi:MAG: NUDIX domain-containing protein, partial [Patescibacteria group bacterium]